MALDTPAKRLRWAREQHGKYRDAAEAARAFGWVSARGNVSTYQGHENGDRNPSRAAAKKYAKAYRVRWEWLLEGEGPATSKAGTIALDGYVGAGEVIIPVDDSDPIGDAPTMIEPNTGALKVRGTSMYPRYFEGETVYYSKDRRHPKDLLNRECVVKVVDGPIYLKILRKGSTKQHFNLESWSAPLIEDQAIEWAAPVTWRRG